MSSSATLSRAFLALALTTGCSLLGGKGSQQPKEEPKPTDTSKNENILEVTVDNTTDADICRLHIREDTLGDAYGWSTNMLNQHGNPKPIKASSKATIKVQFNKPLANPDVYALDCSDQPIMRVYDKPAFQSATGATWTIARADEGTIAAVQQERGIKASTHPMNREDRATSGGGSIEISLVNKCGSTVEYCHESSGSSASSVNGGSSKRLGVSAGDTIKLKSGGSCGQVVHTVSAGSNGQEVVLCK